MSKKRTDIKLEGHFKESRELINIFLEKNENGWRMGTEYSLLDKVFREFPKDANEIELAIDDLVLQVQKIILKSVNQWEKKNIEKESDKN